MNGNQKLRKEVEVLRHELEVAHVEIKLLRQKIDAMAKRMFGKKSEELSPDQLTLLLSGMEEHSRPDGQEDPDPEEPESLKPPKRRARTGRLAIKTPENLEVVEEVLIPEEVKAQPEQWREIGREENKRLDYQPAKFFWHKTIRPRFVRKDQRTLAPVVVRAPEEISLGGKASAGLLAQILVNRYCDHLPYYRQQQLFWRQNQVWISRSQMVQWTHQCVAQLGRVVEVMRHQLQSRPYIQVDETPIRYQDRNRAGPCPQGWMWTGLDPGKAVVFHWEQRRGSQALEKFIGEDYKGLLGVDAHSAYRAYAKTRSNVQLIGCWAHARRKFIEATDEDPRIAGWVLNQISWLFRWEKDSDGSMLSTGCRDSIRASRSPMIIERLHRALIKLLGRYRPKSQMRQAIEYTLNQWKQLTAFLDHPQAELSNNLVENAIRPSALGKKNWIFIGHPKAGHLSAAIYSLTESCRMIGLNPYEYLKDLLQRLPKTPDNQVHELTPANWREALGSPLPLAA